MTGRRAADGFGFEAAIEGSICSQQMGAAYEPMKGNRPQKPTCLLVSLDWPWSISKIINYEMWQFLSSPMQYAVLWFELGLS